jgi:hypothetical protein
MKPSRLALVFHAFTALLVMAPVVAGTLAWAPATGVNLVNDDNNAAVVEVRGHIVYTKGPLPPPYPAGWFVYAWNSHDDQVCGNAFCADGYSVFYHRLKMVSGAGNLADGIDVTFWWDTRVYLGTGTFLSQNAPPDDWLFLDDGDIFENSWSGGASGATSTQSVSYQIGAWQGGQSAWASRTSTGAL